jgi:hypothetical protein
MILQVKPRLCTKVPDLLNGLLDYSKQCGGYEKKKYEAGNRDPPITLNGHEIFHDGFNLSCRLSPERTGDRAKQLVIDAFRLKVQAENMNENNDYRREGKRGKECCGR